MKKKPTPSTSTYPVDQTIAFIVFVLCLLLAIYLHPPLLNDISTSVVQI